MQCSKIFHTGQIRNFFGRYINFYNLFQFTNCQNIIRCCIKIFFHIGSEIFIRESGFIDGNPNSKRYGNGAGKDAFSSNDCVSCTGMLVVCIRNGIIDILFKGILTILKNYIGSHRRTSINLFRNFLYHAFC